MAQRDSQKSKIDGHEYEVFMLPPKVARRLLVEMSKVVGPALGGIMSSGAGLAKLMEMSVEGVDWAAVISGLTDRLSADMLDEHMEVLAKSTHVDGKELAPIFDHHFRGALGGMFKWYGFALKVNYGNFFSALESVSAPLTEAAKAKASQSQST